MRARIVACAACPRLRGYCQRIAIEKKAAHRDDSYWGKPVPGFGDPDARLLLVGLAPAAHGANRTGRVFTGDGSGDFLMRALRANGFASLGTFTPPDYPPINQPASSLPYASVVGSRLRTLDRCPGPC